MATISVPLRPALIALGLGDLLVAAAYPLLWAIGDAAPWRLSALVDPRGDTTLVAWYAGVQLALLACGLALFAGTWRERRGLAWWCVVALSAAFVGLSLDAIAQLHELLRQRSDRVLLTLFGDGTPIFYTRLWLIVLAGPLGLCLVALGWGARRHAPSGVRRRALIGLLFALGGAVLLEPECIPWRGAAYVLALAAAQLAELAGITAMVWAAADLLQTPVGQRLRDGAAQRFPAAAAADPADRRRETA